MVESETASRLESLARLYRQGYRSPVVDQAVEKLVALEAERSRNDLQRLEERLSAYEKKYGQSSAAFYAKFRAGEMGDDMARCGRCFSLRCCGWMSWTGSAHDS